MRSQGYADSYVARGLTDLRDGRYDTEEAEAVSGSIHRVTGLSELARAGRGTRESVAAIPAYGYGLGNVRRFEIDAEESFREYRKSAGATGGAGIERTRSFIEEGSAAVREEAVRVRERSQGKIETGKRKTAEDFAAGQAGIQDGGENLRRSTKGVRERLESAKSESVAREQSASEQRMSEISKGIENNRVQQEKNNPN